MQRPPKHAVIARLVWPEFDKFTASARRALIAYLNHMRLIDGYHRKPLFQFTKKCIKLKLAAIFRGV